MDGTAGRLSINEIEVHLELGTAGLQLACHLYPWLTASVILSIVQEAPTGRQAQLTGVSPTSQP